MWLGGYHSSKATIHSLAEPQPAGGPMLNAIRDYCATHKVNVCVGYAELDTGKSTVEKPVIYNAAIVFGTDGQIVHNYRKTHLYGEMEEVRPGGRKWGRKTR
eukprot:m.118882 g.118882  ORF g.118882 m.118882 type:complete len:102 (+) comp23147_c0_seq1:230-535(+)